MENSECKAVTSEPIPNLIDRFNFTALRRHSINPHIRVESSGYQTLQDLIVYASHTAARRQHTIDLLDIGGGSGKRYEMVMRQQTNYTSLDFALPPDHGTSGRPRSVIGSVQRCNAHLPSSSYDMVSALNVFEHIVAPWRAATEMLRLVKNGGLLIVIAPFSIRYHAYPIDTYRYTHTALRYLFERHGGVSTLYSAYCSDNSSVVVNGHYADRSDYPPLPRFRISPYISLLWVGRREDGTPFSPSTFDRNQAFPPLDLQL